MQLSESGRAVLRGKSTNEERAREIAIQVLDEFEELLAAKGIMIRSQDREGREEEACLYGTEYYELEDAVTGILVGQTGEAQEPSGRLP